MRAVKPVQVVSATGAKEEDVCAMLPVKPTSPYLQHAEEAVQEEKEEVAEGETPKERPEKEEEDGEESKIKEVEAPKIPVEMGAEPSKDKPEKVDGSSMTAAERS
jgi:hypothetical protein